MRRLSKIFISLLLIAMVFSFVAISDAATTKVAGLKAANSTSGITISWTKMSGASKYRLYYKVSTDAKYTKIVDTTKNSYTMAGLTSGVKYTFCVRAYITKSKTWTDNATVSLTYMAMPKISSMATTNKNGLKVSWGKVNGAEKYRVYYKIDGEQSYTKYGDTTDTSSIIYNLQNNTSYYIVVRAYGGKSWSTYTAYKTTTNFNIERIESVSNSGDGVYLYWTPFEDDSENSFYRVYYRQANSTTWYKFTDIIYNECYVTGLKVGAQYVFTVKYYNGSLWSYYVPSNSLTVCSSEEHDYAETATQDCLCKKATCSSPAIYYYKCNICGEISKDTYEYGYAIEHDYSNNVVTFEPTCTNSGMEISTCRLCGEQDFQALAPLGHSYNSWEKDEVDHWHRCERCGECEDIEEHEFGAWLEVSNTDERTVKERTCYTCGYKEQETIDKEFCVHNWEVYSETQECPSIVTYNCTICGAYKTEKYAHYNLGENTVWWENLVEAEDGKYRNPYTEEATEYYSEGYFCEYCHKRCAGN